VGASHCQRDVTLQEATFLSYVRADLFLFHQLLSVEQTRRETVDEMVAAEARRRWQGRF
jgi:hypothetical protein